MARDFDGVDDLINCGSGATALNGVIPMTVAAWINTNTVTGYHRILSRLYSGGGNGYAFGINGDEISFTKAGIIDISSTSINLITGTWFFIASVVTSTQVRFIKIATDGTFTAENVSDSNIINSASYDLSYIGTWDGSATFWDGKLGDIYKFDTNLTDSEVMALSLGSLPKISVLKGWWPLFGEQSPEPDWSGNNNHGTVTGAVRADHPPGISAVWLAPNPQRVQRVVAVAGGDPEGSLIGGKLIRGGLLHHGVLVGR